MKMDAFQNEKDGKYLKQTINLSIDNHRKPKAMCNEKSPDICFFELGKLVTIYSNKVPEK